MKVKVKEAKSMISYLYNEKTPKSVLDEILRQLNNKRIQLHITNQDDINSSYTMSPARLTRLLDEMEEEDKYRMINKIEIESSDGTYKSFTWFTHDWKYKQNKCARITVYLKEENYVKLSLKDVITEVRPSESEEDSHYRWENDLDLDKGVL